MRNLTFNESSPYLAGKVDQRDGARCARHTRGHAEVFDA